MMKTLLIGIIILFSQTTFSCLQASTIITKSFGIYKLKDIGTEITDQEALESVINWIYRFQYDTITFRKDIIIFGDYVENNPIYNIEYKGFESSVQLSTGIRDYTVTCSDFMGYFPEIERLYDFVVNVVNISPLFIIELLDNNHIVIEVNNVYVLYEKISKNTT